MFDIFLIFERVYENKIFLSFSSLNINYFGYVVLKMLFRSSFIGTKRAELYLK